MGKLLFLDQIVGFGLFDSANLDIFGYVFDLLDLFLLLTFEDFFFTSQIIDFLFDVRAKFFLLLILLFLLKFRLL